jgi:hypothetical protein
MPKHEDRPGDMRPASDGPMILAAIALVLSAINLVWIICTKFA